MKPMTTADILRTCPIDLGYQRTDDICWFIGRGSSPFEDEKRILAQRMTSVYQEVEDVWVAVPTVELPNARGQSREPGAGHE